MMIDSTSQAGPAKEPAHFLGDEWFDPLEAEIRRRTRSFIEERAAAYLLVFIVEATLTFATTSLISRSCDNP